MSVTVWNNEIHRARTVWSAPLSNWSNPVEQKSVWLPTTDVCLLHIVEMNKEIFFSRLLMLMPLRDTVREIPTSGLMRFDSNPLQPCALLQDYEQSAQGGDLHSSHFRILHADGSLQPMQDFPQKDMFPTHWSPDGKSYYAYAVTRVAKGKPTVEHYALNAATGEWKSLEAKGDADSAPLPLPEPLKSDLRIVRGTAAITQDGAKRTVHPVWLETTAKTGPPRVLIAADCDEAVLSPKGDAVLYRTQEGAFVMPLTKVSALALTEALKAVAMSHAKQVGLGLMMYVQDYDEQFPLTEFNIADTVNPYVKNADVFEGFTYSYPAKSVGEIAKPAETIMGTVAGPGGEAVIYADGHVKWRDKK